ncbi:MAG: hypothetical protein K8F52_01630 [Candidatus Scalindua rubra]|nr:hypothetical protein [Candidatus Scalindua rubra]TWU31460.1 hypothetical protein S225a_21320 [Candidatus Brocadiaceae bacterium S225]
MTNINLQKFNVFVNNIKYLAKDPEHFLTSKYQKYRNPHGFRIELYTARRYNSIRSKFRWFQLSKLNATGIVPKHKKRIVHSAHFWSKSKQPESTFCPYCEKSVVPKRLHKLDIADIIIALLTAGLWAIFLFAMYLFVRRCPVCNYNLRGFRFLSDKKKR